MRTTQGRENGTFIVIIIVFIFTCGDESYQTLRRDHCKQMPNREDLWSCRMQQGVASLLKRNFIISDNLSRANRYKSTMIVTFYLVQIYY